MTFPEEYGNMSENRMPEDDEVRLNAQPTHDPGTGLSGVTWPVQHQPDLVGFPKIGRLNRDIVITEKIDGTTGAIVVNGLGVVFAQNKHRVLTLKADNFGFAAWVHEHAAALGAALGEGVHFGEWWGKGIQRHYDLPGRRFSLFNVKRWRVIGGDVVDEIALAQAGGVDISVVPVLYRGPWTNVLGFVDNETGEFSTDPEVQPNPRERFASNFSLEYLKRCGSVAAPGFQKPEGIVVYHVASNTMLKATILKDERHKGEIA